MGADPEATGLTPNIGLGAEGLCLPPTPPKLRRRAEIADPAAPRLPPWGRWRSRISRSWQADRQPPPPQGRTPGRRAGRRGRGRSLRAGCQPPWNLQPPRLLRAAGLRGE